MSQRKDSGQLGEQFHNPPASLRPMAFWSLNGELTKRGIERWLREFKEHGMGGAFMHPRPGLVTEYLSEEWWTLWDHALTVARDLGIELHIYDENSYPSGFAGGHVPGSNPHTVASRVTLVPVATAVQAETMAASGFLELHTEDTGAPGLTESRSEDRSVDDGGAAQNERLVRGAGARNLGDGATKASGRSVARSVTRDQAVDILNSDRPARVVAVVTLRAEPRAFKAGFGSVDTTNPDTTNAFLATTHEEYAKRFGSSFGSEIKYAFTDEPNPDHGNGFAISPLMLSEFADEHGYRLEEVWGDLWFGDGAVRYDYFKTLNRLFLDNFVTPVDEWCREHGVGFTGHYWEHSWPSPKNQPDNMAAMARMEIPGNDLLEFQINQRSFWPKAVLNLKELSSVASQQGSDRTMVENGGAGGYDTGIWEFRRTDHTLLCFGVSIYAPHLTHYSLAGPRKYEWPQQLGEPASWWRHYPAHALAVSRVTSLITQSEERNRIAVLEPTRSGWTRYIPPAVAAVDSRVFEQSVASMEQLEAEFTAFVLELFERGVDFDLVEESSLHSAGVNDGAIQIGRRAYSVLAVSSSTDVLDTRTSEALAALLRSGADIVTSGEAPMIGGREGSDRSAEAVWAASRRVDGDQALADALVEAAPPRVLGGPLPRGVAWHRRELPGAVITILGSSIDETARVTLLSERERLYELDPSTGFARIVREDGASSESNAAPHEITLEPRGLRVFFSSDRPAEQWGFTVTANVEPANRVSRTSNPRKIPAAGRRIRPNVLVVDYCDLGRGEDAPLAGVHVQAADAQLWRWAGAAGNAWDRAVQYRRTVLDATYRPVAPRVTYHVPITTLRDTALAELALVLERPERWHILVNGNEIARSSLYPWELEDFAIAKIGTHLTQGDNAIVLSGDRFDPLMEIAPITLLGDFDLDPVEHGYALREVSSGEASGATTSTESATPFYPWDLSYEPGQVASGETVVFDFDGAFAELRCGEWREVVYGGRAVVTVPEGIGGELEILIGASAQNYFGPWHSEGLALSSTWADAPSQQPAGGEYMFRPCGIRGEVTVR